MRTGHVMRGVGLDDPDALRGSGLWFFLDDAKPVILPEGRSRLAPTRRPARTSHRLPWRPTTEMGGVLPQRWSPPPRAPGVHETSVNINLDDSRLGDVAYHVARANQHVAAAAQFDAGAMHMPVDLQTA